MKNDEYMVSQFQHSPYYRFHSFNSTNPRPSEEIDYSSTPDMVWKYENYDWDKDRQVTLLRLLPVSSIYAFSVGCTSIDVSNEISLDKNVGLTGDSAPVRENP